MDIVIIANFCDDFKIINNDRFLYIANLLSEKHSVEVITSDFFHTTKKERSGDIPPSKFKITCLHEPGYKRNVCLSRFYSHFVWGKNVKKYLEMRKHADVIYTAVPSLTAAKEAAQYCKRNNIKFVIDVQDLWPEAFKMIINLPIISSLVFYPFKRVANEIYSSADLICAVSDTYVNRALKENKKNSKGISVYLGTNLDVFDENVKKYAKQLNLNNKIKLAYCGTLGSSYDLPVVFDALSILKEESIEVEFIIMGDGPRYDEFVDYARKLGLSVNFVGRIPYDKMCALLSECDICVNPIVKKSAASIINKHADYAASGKPVINTQISIEYKKLIEEYNMGFNCKNSLEISQAIKKLINDKELRKTMGYNARKCAEEMFDRAHTYRLIVKGIENDI
ncbi:glycosyltransferase family 4 protein [Treponema pectinovorum]|uniref:glycosyltransferase family 4 protein n=1 Tax=Treponema pectinovorum TaxID=164 RepID=UPI0011F3A138|nr:glycosyltransferase family 4 protein [Treponema pectinovorum]